MPTKLPQELMPAHNWEDPVLFESFRTPAFPIESLPPILSEMAVSVSDVTQTPIDASAVALLPMISTAVAKKFIVKLTQHGEGWTEKNNIYVCIALPSGERKSAIFSHLIKPIIHYERRLQAQMFTDSNEFIDRSQRLVADDATPAVLAELLEQNNARIALLSTEGGVFDMLASRHYGKLQNLDAYLKGFSGDRITIDRKKAGSIIINDPTVTIGVFVQPAMLNSIPERLIGRGLMGRFLYTMPSSNMGERDIELKSMPPEVTSRYYDLLTGLLRFNPQRPIPLLLSPEALELFQNFRKGYEPQLGRGGELSHEFLRAWCERLPGQLLRIAAAYHAVILNMNDQLESERLDNSISGETMHRALLLSDYFIEHAKAAFGCVKTNEASADAKYLLNVLERKRIPLYKRQTLWSAVKGKFSTAETFDNALAVLEDRGFIRISKVRSERGRDGTQIECHPSITSSSATN
ncbi:YfjI family protein [Paenibacillus chungangensis]|uniref:YfjI family protein n=1 Tax=Paenibacillus chungangensis TaxID=696535 RepID=A0ABW3HKH3_9BACL